MSPARTAPCTSHEWAATSATFSGASSTRWQAQRYTRAGGLNEAMRSVENVSRR
jgi:hypothetical protein